MKTIPNYKQKVINEFFACFTRKRALTYIEWKPKLRTGEVIDFIINAIDKAPSKDIKLKVNPNFQYRIDSESNLYEDIDSKYDV